MSLDAENRKYFVDVFDDYVADVRLDYDVSNEKPYYMHGTPQEINTILAELATSPTLSDKRFPLIILVEDFTEIWKYNDTFYSVNPKVLIVTETRQEYTSEERYANTFKPVLVPIRDLLFDKIEFSPNTSQIMEGIDFSETKHPAWGRFGIYGNEGKLFDDRLDCIELDIKDLKINKKC